MLLTQVSVCDSQLKHPDGQGWILFFLTFNQLKWMKEKQRGREILCLSKSGIEKGLVTNLISVTNIKTNSL